MRDAGKEDIPTLIEMGRAMHDESPRYSRTGYAPEKLRALGERIVGTLATGRNGFMAIAENDEGPVGMMVGFVSEMFFSHDKIASDYVLYVKPENRKGRAAFLLVRAFEQWAVANGADDIVPGTSSMIDADGTRRFYQKLGYEHYGYTMIKRITHEQRSEE